MLQDFWERPAAGGFGHVPKRGFHPHRGAKIGGTGANAALGADDDGARAGRAAQITCEVGQKRVFAGVF